MNATERATLINLRRFVSFLVLIAQIVTSTSATALYKKAGVAAWKSFLFLCRTAYRLGFTLRELINRLENSGIAPHQMAVDSAKKIQKKVQPFILNQFANLRLHKSEISARLDRFMTEIKLINQW